MNKRIVIAGLGDTGILTAIHLAPHFDIVGISPKPGLVSGQELGLRLARPQRWSRDYLVPFERFVGLDGVESVHGTIESINPSSRQVIVRRVGGNQSTLPYDALVIATGVTSGFWREPSVEDLATIRHRVDAAAAQIRSAASVAIIGGGPAGVSAARNIARIDGARDIHLFFPHERVLPGYHRRVRGHATRLLVDAGVQLHAGHRAAVPTTSDRPSRDVSSKKAEQLTTETVRWTTGQAPFHADRTLWTIGRVTPNTGFLPNDMLDDDGFVLVEPTLRVSGHTNVFAIGDVAATDPNRSSARNWAYKILAHNIRQYFSGNDAGMKSFEAPENRWGSIFGPDDDDGLRVFFANGRSMRIPPWLERNLLTPVITKRMIYKGIRPADER